MAICLLGSVIIVAVSASLGGIVVVGHNVVVVVICAMACSGNTGGGCWVAGLMSLGGSKKWRGENEARGSSWFVVGTHQMALPHSSVESPYLHLLVVSPSHCCIVDSEHEQRQTSWLVFRNSPLGPTSLIGGESAKTVAAGKEHGPEKRRKLITPPIEWLLKAPTFQHVLMHPLQAEIHCEKDKTAKCWLVIVCFWSQ